MEWDKIVNVSHVSFEAGAVPKNDVTVLIYQFGPNEIPEIALYEYFCIFGLRFNLNVLDTVSGNRLSVTKGRGYFNSQTGSQGNSFNRMPKKFGSFFSTVVNQEFSLIWSDNQSPENFLLVDSGAYEVSIALDFPTYVPLATNTIDAALTFNMGFKNRKT